MSCKNLAMSQFEFLLVTQSRNRSETRCAS